MLSAEQHIINAIKSCMEINVIDSNTIIYVKQLKSLMQLSTLIYNHLVSNILIMVFEELRII